jgi:hypothetical protein
LLLGFLKLHNAAIYFTILASHPIPLTAYQNRARQGFGAREPQYREGRVLSQQPLKPSAAKRSANAICSSWTCRSAGSCRGCRRHRRSSRFGAGRTLALEGLEAVDLTFGLSVAPGQLDGVIDGIESLRKTRANRMIGMMSESIASSIQGSSVSDLLLRRIPLKRIARRRISANASDPCFRASTFPCLSRRQQASWLYAQRRGNNWRNRVAGIRISNGSQADRHRRNIIGAHSFRPAAKLPAVAPDWRSCRCSRAA